MNKGLLTLNIILLVCVGVLFFLFFSKKDNSTPVMPARSKPDPEVQSQQIPVAYFDMDSVETNFTLWKQTQDEMMKREQAKNDSINMLRTNFQKYIQRLQPQFEALNPRQRDSLNNILGQMDADLKNKATELNQNYQTYYMSRQTEIVTKIKNYCKEFNKDKKYAFIIAREPGLFYYTDTAYNVTSELLKGLNAFYSKKK